MTGVEVDLAAVKARAEAAPVYAQAGIALGGGQAAFRLAAEAAARSAADVPALVAEVEFQRQRVDVALQQRAEFEAEVERLRELIRGENVNARKLADALDAQLSAEQERDELRTDHSGQINSRDHDLATYELALEDIAKLTQYTTAAMAARALAQVEARHQP